MTGKRAIITGASNGIGRALAHSLSADGYGVGLVARRGVLLQELHAAIRKRRKHIYVTRRWRLIAGIIRILPDRIAHKL